MSVVDRAATHRFSARNGRPRKGAGWLVLVTTTACAGADSNDASGASSLEEMETITLITSDYGSPNSANSLATVAFTSEVEDKTDGKINFESYFGGSLLPTTEILNGVSTGAADIALMVTGPFPQDLPASNWLLEMGAMTDAEFPGGILASAAATHVQFTESEALVSELAAHNLKALTAVDLSDTDYPCTKQVDSLADAEGLRVRTTSASGAAEAEALGMVPVSLATEELYEGLQRGVVDCAALSAIGVVDQGLGDVISSFIRLGLATYPGSVLVMNLDTWESLPEDVQQIVDDARFTYWRTYVENALGQYAEFSELAASEGIDIVNPIDVEEKLASYATDLRAELVGKAPSDVANPDEFVQERADLLAEWASAFDESLAAVGAGEGDDFSSAADVDVAELAHLLQQATEEK